MKFFPTEQTQLFEVATCRKFRLRLFWELPRLICKNDKALRKSGVLAYQFDTPERASSSKSEGKYVAYLCGIPQGLTLVYFET